MEIENAIERISKLYSDNEKLCQKYIDWFLERAIANDSEQLPAAVQRVSDFCLQRSIPCTLHLVEDDYYDWPLYKRACRLQAPSCSHLCKSIIFENTHLPQGNCQEPRYFCVIVQYVSKLNSQKLTQFIRSSLKDPLPKKYYNLRLAPEHISHELTGFMRNGVSPFGMQTPIPVIVDSGVADLKPAVLYLGAGLPEWKVCVRFDDLVSGLGAHVADLH